MNSDKITNVTNDIIDILVNRDLTYIEAVVIVDILRTHILKKVRGEDNE